MDAKEIKESLPKFGSELFQWRFDKELLMVEDSFRRYPHIEHYAYVNFSYELKEYVDFVINRFTELGFIVDGIPTYIFGSFSGSILIKLPL